MLSIVGLSTREDLTRHNDAKHCELRCTNGVGDQKMGESNTKAMVDGV
jgi:hypothetical protein